MYYEYMNSHIHTLNFICLYFFYFALQDAMVHIWKALVADSKKTIDEHLDLIIDDLLLQCGSRLWRSREASCLALADIIQGRKFYEVINITVF